MTSKKWNLALLQMDIAIGEPDKNFAKLEALLEEAVAGDVKPDVIIFPEMWNTGYALERIRELADREGERTRALLSAFSRKHGVLIVGGSVADLREDGVYNTIYSYDREGEQAGAYSKIHLFRLMDEEKFLLSGSEVGRLELDGVPAGAMICYDIRFPELARRLALGGAQVLFVPAEWPKPRLHHWRTLLTARAIENQMFVVSCNRVGVSGTTEFFGHSMVIDPWGEVIAEGDESERIIRATIDLGLVPEVRSRIPIFEDRRPSLYQE
ncbi:carbon-nitrogen family hydrolase [Paenibacillus mucilaginosus]|uniref:Nitrilase/cyanide hydratase and apolipoprotein N-acyltransferase n=2 Tax=Paenibacillus mucilaginosus TaxID=61624 RepID=I0BQ15_9BACL|nr:carbon-nitrogen family hydrolase [Paenibacillus mucilaginosus]AEI42551.1 Nitrilase/cyanide hydratase and apolipoprotein N-acyltransferase [Paenibacillus mucilaginosus KNP414]AFH64462.1 nitrilase/cyanide hydratase and apolipoprotein N-acyltransferase [Paenibacillus mucilaginosus K02]MCG7213944.1 carbon-nitrogen family hydrolase [Paenibacillus mucilaginosus]WDM25947.1 carbon-nitrogen family hydrolase [Paenibacillus mucilaginosus]